jgi:hypothetical protein
LIIQRVGEELVLSEFGEFLAGLLNRITFCSDPSDSPKAEQRLYPDPSNDQHLNEDWRDYVQPDLKHLFETANEVVNGDLALIEQPKKTPEFILRIPLPHAESWLSSLNQARLALAANFDLTQEDMEQDLPEILTSERELAVLQVNLYGAIQEHLIQAISGNE